MREKIYQRGGNSCPFADVTISEGVFSRIPKGTTVAVNQGNKTGSLMEDIGIGATSVRILYSTSNFTQCAVGALSLVDAVFLQGCYPETGLLFFNGTGDTYKYTYGILEDNQNGRTLQSFSSGAEDQMLLCGDNCQYTTFDKFFRYYKVSDYADRFILAAFDQSDALFSQRLVSFRHIDELGRAEAIKTGVVTLNVWMQVIREMEDAVNQCEGLQLDKALHSWDSAHAFYTGSLQPQRKAGSGILLHALAKHTALLFKPVMKWRGPHQ